MICNVIDFLEYKRRKEALGISQPTVAGLPPDPALDDLFDYIFTQVDKMDQSSCGDDPLTVTMSVNEWVRLYNGIVDDLDVERA